MNRDLAKKISISLILLTLLLAFFLRIYRVWDLLDFHYDQGRDAMVIWNLWHNGKFFLIGPVTGLPGIFLGPLYYYLIAVPYLIGGGNPVYPSIFLSSLVTLGLFFLYKAGEKIGDKKLGFIALMVGSFSYSLVMSGRWLSNPTPIYLTSILIFYLMYLVTLKSKNVYWYLIFLFAGVSFHFESASAAFYMPVVLAFCIWQRKKLDLKTFFISGFLLFLTFTPQLIFNFKHGNILLNNILQELPKQERISGNWQLMLTDRLKLFWEMFSNKLFVENRTYSKISILVSFVGLIFLIKNKKFTNIIKLFALFLLIPFSIYTIYRGNHGFLYDYYFTGYYLILVLLFSLGMWSISKKPLGGMVVTIFLVLFLMDNGKYFVRRFTVGVNDGQDIFISNQLQAIDWIYKNAGDSEFNVDVYVPPVIAHSYNYLFTYRGDKRTEKNVKKLYTLYEIDPPHPERLDAWLARQKGIGEVRETVEFGGITVERRERYDKQK